MAKRYVSINGNQDKYQRYLNDYKYFKIFLILILILSQFIYKFKFFIYFYLWTIQTSKIIYY